MTVLFYDTFQGAGEAIESHTSDSGGSWTKPYGSPLLVTDGAQPYVLPAGYGFNVRADTAGYTYPPQFLCATVEFDIAYPTGKYSGAVYVGLDYAAVDADIELSVTMWDDGVRASAPGIPGLGIPVALVQGVNTLEIRLDRSSGDISYLMNGGVLATANVGPRSLAVTPYICAGDDADGEIGQTDVTLVFRSFGLYDTLIPTPPEPPVVARYWWRNAKNAILEPL